MRGKRLAKDIGLAQEDVAPDLGDMMSAVAFDDLSIEQAWVDAPGAAAFVGGLHPGAEMSRQRIEVERQAITGKHRQTIRGKRWATSWTS